ncbi:histone-like nucleoid-structuring protein Lsr2 [Arthrobacter sp. KNU40]|uniref:histone-like nucleoid-structuring protein Lsr2 n=1 Tax=Arthrobacter sp. KNU40 TaxID=3447965 RepID=UPI003F62880E
MAKETITIIRDDLDGSENAKSYKFGWGDNQYEIDLSEKNAKELQDFLGKYIGVAAKVTARLPRSAGSPAPKSNREELQKIRSWALGQGLNVSPRGRISGDVIKAYEAAH